MRWRDLRPGDIEGVKGDPVWPKGTRERRVEPRIRLKDRSERRAQLTPHIDDGTRSEYGT